MAWKKKMTCVLVEPMACFYYGDVDRINGLHTKKRRKGLTLPKMTDWCILE